MIDNPSRELILKSERSFALLANPDTRDLEFVRLDGGLPFSEEDIRLDIALRGLRYAGTVGIVDGKPRFVLHEAFDLLTTIALDRAVTVSVGVLLGDGVPEPQDDFESFARGLFHLEDPRS